MSISFSDPEDVPSEDPAAQGDTIWDGFLLKQGGARGGFKNWKKRWFRLDQENLCYYKQKLVANVLGAAPAKPLDDDNNVVLSIMPIRNASVLDITLPDEVSAVELDKPPIWEIAAPSCHECKVEFGGATRRRYCRACGYAHCSACSPRTVSVSRTGFSDPVRVCNHCFNGITSAGAPGYQPPPRSGSIKALDDGTIVKALEPKKTKGFDWGRGRKFEFAIIAVERELFLQADCSTVKLEVMTAIKSVVIYHRQQRLMKIPPPLSMTSPKHARSKRDDNALPSGKTLGKPHDSASNRWSVEFKAIKILHEVCEGAIGTVYKGRLWGTDVAVKTIRNISLAKDLEKEVAIVSQLRHPNVVLYIGACLETPNVAVVTEWCDRGSLFDLLYDEKPGSINLDFQSIIALAIGIAQGMNYLHSLNQKIIHRDLKSHNILVDSHFAPKVADFGLSKLDPQIATASLAIGHQKAIRAHEAKKQHAADQPVATSRMSIQANGGTAEWMAPEVMEGAPYNQSVDIYSYGIVLSELLSRQLPFRDRYTINGYADVVEAVLDDGAMPTIPAWCGPKMQKLVGDCLNRNADARPSFNEIILRLRSFYPLDMQDTFPKYDVPRLLSMLEDPNRTHQLRATRELADMSRDITDPCHVCGHSPNRYQFMTDSVVIQFISSLNNTLMSLDSEIVLNAIDAIGLIISNATVLSVRGHLIGILRDSGTILRMSAYLDSTDETMSNAAAGLLSLLFEDISASDNPTTFSGLNGVALEKLYDLAKKDTRDLQLDLNDISVSLDRKVALCDWLRIRRAETGVEDLTSMMAPSVVRPLTLKPRIELSGAQQIENVRDVAAGSFENKDLPVQLRAEMGRSAKCWGWIGLLDSAGEQWIDVYAVLNDATLCILESEEARPENVKWKIRIRVGNVCSKFRSGRKRGRQNCLQVAVPAELMPVAVDPRAPPVQRLFINIGSEQRFTFWIGHVNQYLDIPVSLAQTEPATE